MTLKIGTLTLLAGAALTAAAQSPTAVENIYSQVGANRVDGQFVTYEFANWYSVASAADGVSLWPAIFGAVAEGNTVTTLVEGVLAEADGIAISWNAVDKLLSVNCESGKLGRTQVLIADYNGVNRGVVDVNDSPATISLSNYVPGTYVVAVAVDGKLAKTLKLILK